MDIEQTLQSKEARETLVSILMPPSLGVTTESIFYVPSNPECHDQSNKWNILNQELLDKLTKAPSIDISSDAVTPIPIGEFDKIVEAMEEEIRQLRAGGSTQRQQLEKQTKEEKKQKNKAKWFHFPPPPQAPN